MKLETTPAFDADYRRVNREHREAFRQVLTAGGAQQKSGTEHRAAPSYPI